MTYHYCRSVFLFSFLFVEANNGHCAQGPNAICHTVHGIGHCTCPTRFVAAKNCTQITTAPQWRCRCARSTEGDNNSLHWISSSHSMRGRQNVCMRHTIRTCKWDSGVDRPKVFSHGLLLQGHEILHQPHVEMDLVDHAPSPSKRSFQT